MENNTGYTAGEAERCKFCGNPIVAITVNISSTVEPFIPIARAMICRKCYDIRNGWLLPVAKKYNITAKNVRVLLVESKCADMFKIHELQSGVMDEPEYSESLLKIFAANPEIKRDSTPCKPQFYNPDKFHQQEIEEVPF